MYKVDNEALNKAFDPYLENILPKSSPLFKEAISRDQCERLIYLAYAKGWFDSKKAVENVQ